MKTIAVSRPINQVIAGEEVIVAKSGKPVAKLVPFEKPTQDRKPGSAKGKIIISDDFDAPLPDDILKEFYNFPFTLHRAITSNP